MAADVAAAPRRADAAPARRPAPLAAFWRRLSRKPGRGLGLVVVALDRRCWRSSPTCIAPHSPIEQFRDVVRAPPVWDGRRLLALSARHRRRRPRHALAPDLRRARLAVHRPRGDERVASSSASRSAWSAAIRRLVVDVVVTRVMDLIMAVAEPGAGDRRRRGARPQPHQHHRGGHHRLPAALRAPGARLGARRAEQGLCHGRARRRRRAAAADVRRPCCPTAWRR